MRDADQLVTNSDYFGRPIYGKDGDFSRWAINAVAPYSLSSYKYLEGGDSPSWMKALPIAGMTIPSPKSYLKYQGTPGWLSYLKERVR